MTQLNVCRSVSTEKMSLDIGVTTRPLNLALVERLSPVFILGGISHARASCTQLTVPSLLPRSIFSKVVKNVPGSHFEEGCMDLYETLTLTS